MGKLKKEPIIWFSSGSAVSLPLVHTNIEIVIKKGRGTRPGEALATLGFPNFVPEPRRCYILPVLSQIKEKVSWQITKN